MQTLDAIGPSLPGVARRAIESWLRGEQTRPGEESGGPPAPVFVTLRTMDGALRGCIGTLRSTEADVTRETARSAVLAASRDPRFAPVTAEELSDLRVEVSVLFPEERVASTDELDPIEYGVVVRDGQGRQGVLLPNIEGVTEVRDQVDIARRKAGILEGVPLWLSRFRVSKYLG